MSLFHRDTWTQKLCTIAQNLNKKKLLHQNKQLTKTFHWTINCFTWLFNTKICISVRPTLNLKSIKSNNFLTKLNQPKHQTSIKLSLLALPIDIEPHGQIQTKQNTHENFTIIFQYPGMNKINNQNQNKPKTLPFWNTKSKNWYYWLIDQEIKLILQNWRCKVQWTISNSF